MPENNSVTDYRELISRIIKSEMSKRKIRYEDLSQLLAAHGTVQSSANLRNKINRGIMGADLFIQLFLVLNVKQLDRDSILEIVSSLND
ncbi:MAG: hypothetical protein OFPI_04530 [Osedax symbiont Rs2]|nr:MAG: hypothetical protein OFPI_04530 [Osedax symbiont Rs2]OUS36917.1 hypothetical protein A9R01_05290 ['Osedax' symbiont bacterium Rs2_46_30_T18]